MPHSFVTCIATFLFSIISLVVIAQDSTTKVASTLEMAQEVSSATGRPIFAIAGRST